MDNKLTRQETANALATVNLYPVAVEYEKAELVRKKKSLPSVEIGSLGMTFEPLTHAVQTVVNGAGGSGLYMVNTSGLQMFEAKGIEGAYRAGLQAANGGVGGGQALLTPLALNPTMLGAAVAVAGINAKLSDIQATQEEILSHLKRQEESKIIGNIKFMERIAKEYQYNWNNKQYIDAHYQQVLSIERESEQEIISLQKEIEEKINKKKFLHSYKDANDMKLKVINTFKNYQRAIYMNSFSTFLDVLLLANYDRALLKEKTARLEAYSTDYRELYSKAYTQIQDYLGGSFGQGVLEVFGSLNKNVGDTLAEIPLVKELTFDEALQGVGNKVLREKTRQVNKSMKKMKQVRLTNVRPFIENIDLLNRIYNEGSVLYFDNERLYLE